VLGSVEDEQVFSIVAFLKTKVRNRLVDHLPLVVNIFGQTHLTLENLPYDKCIADWEANKKKRGRHGMHQ
jgi:hypothetical protein